MRWAARGKRPKISLFLWMWETELGLKRDSFQPGSRIHRGAGVALPLWGGEIHEQIMRRKGEEGGCEETHWSPCNSLLSLENYVCP